MSKEILLVDDDTAGASILSDLLGDAGYNVTRADNGIEGSELFADLPHGAIVLSDHQMPEMTGMEMLKIVREQRPDLYRIIMSADFTLRPASKGDAIFACNPHLLVPKPVESLGEFIGSIRELLQRRRVLVVEDMDSTRTAVGALLNKAGFASIEAPDAETAALMLEHLPEASVIFSDQNMAEMTGVELLKIAMETRPDLIRFLATSDAHFDEFRRTATAACAPHFVRKPYRTQNIVKLIEALFSPGDQPT